MTSLVRPTNYYSLFREAIINYAGGEAALEELSRQGVDSDRFIEHLARTATFLLPPSGPRRQREWEIPGMPRRRLVKLAGRLEGLADELARIDSHQFIKGTYGMLPREWEDEFKGLPNLLRDRAFALKVQVGVNSHLYPLINREIGKRAKISLMELVRQEAQNGRPMYREVALLLTAALRDGGCDEDVTPESLRTLWHAEQVRLKSLEV
jgi:hypothetical protein